MRAIVRVFVSLVVAWLSVLSPSVGWATPSATAYAYDSQHRPALVVTDSFEPSPPVPASIGSTDDAVHSPSRGASARLNTSTTPTDSTYVHPVRLVPVASVTPTAERPAETARAAISSRNRPEVAANSGQKWAYRGVGRDHPGYDDALTGRVNPRNPNGTATPEQHNLGNTTDSPYTSWTRDPDIARRFAGPDGVVVRVPRGEGSPYKFEWSPDVFYEQEILIRGPICGALIC